ncbi:SAV0927 family protein [Neobacillus mesonae]|uniref:Protein dltD n=1 Tax=Neobacillus mesonae TaxID=1193713 RepID=A0A3T0HU03_9BACI|nr:SAV0927 family protein [Neobacillus mesonae]AZU60612.1 protein dltD precursor [Neobacillus mesonae]
MILDHLLEEVENQLVKYYCIVSEDCRYDIVVIHSERFFGKAMVVSIQNSRMVLLSHHDIADEDYWAEKLDIKSSDVTEFRNFLHLVLDKYQLTEQF